MTLSCGPATVREWREDDLDSLVRFANNRKVWRNLKDRFPHPYTTADAEAWLGHAVGAVPARNWAIEIDGVAAGGIGIMPGEDVYAKSTHIGYWLGEPYWGRGIMTSVLDAVVDHVFSSFDFVRLEAPVYEWNPASMRVLEKCGFAREGVLKRSVYKDGALIDSVLYARLR